MARRRGTFRVGTSGWQYPHWKGAFYPLELPADRWFDSYAMRFDTVEVNNTFYHLPGSATCAATSRAIVASSGDVVYHGHSEGAMARFADRAEAGRELAKALQRYRGRVDLVVLALPRGGVVVGWEVARALAAPLEVFLVRKLGVPGHEELAMGAIASGGVRVMNEDVVRSLSVSKDEIRRVTEREQEELARRERLYRGERPPPQVKGRTVLLVDDGLATGASMRAAVSALKAMAPAAVVVAVPTAPEETCEEFEAIVDELVCLTMPVPFYGVGGSYDDFAQTTDREVCRLLEAAAGAEQGGAP